MKKQNNFASAINLDEDFDTVADLADKALNDKNNINYDRFKNGNLRKEVSKIMTIKTTQYQFEIVQNLAKLKGITIKDLFLNYVAEEAKKQGLFNQLKD